MLFRKILGVATLNHLMGEVTKGRVSLEDPVSKALFKKFRKVGNG